MIIGEKRIVQNKILCRKVNWLGQNLRINYLLPDGIEIHVTEVIGEGRRRTQLLDDLRNKRMGDKGGSWR